MRAVLENVRREPALVTSTVGAIIALLVAYHVPVTEDQRAAIIGLAVVATGLVIRQQVTPTVAVAAQEDHRGRIVSGPADAIRPDGTPVEVVPAEGEPGRHRRE